MSDLLDKIESSLGCRLPDVYKLWANAGRMNHRGDSYLYIYEAEWIQLGDLFPPELPATAPHLPGLVPFAFTGGGDAWCWNLNCPAGIGNDYQVLCCRHDEDAADIYAPTLPDGIYRLALDWASDLDEEEEQRKGLRNVAAALKEVGRNQECSHLLALSEAESQESRYGQALIGEKELDALITQRFGPDYLRHQINWQGDNLGEISEIDPPRPIEEVRAHMEAVRRMKRFEASLGVAEQAFRDQDWGKHVSMLENYTDLLSPIQLKKFQLAKKKVT